MPNKVTELYRQYLASTGQTDDRSDYEITAELGQWASQNNPNLFDRFSDFGQEFGAIREANAPGLGAEFGRALKAGTQGLASTALGGLSLLTDSDYLAEKAASFEQDAAANAPTIPTLEDIAPGRRGVGSLFSKDAARYGVSKLGSVVPSIAEAMGLAAAGAAVGSAAAPGPGTVAGAAEGLMARGLIKSAIRSMIRKGSAEALVERGVLGEATEAALEQAVRQSIPTVTDLVGREAMAIGARRGLAATNLANSFLLNAGDVYSEGGDRGTAAALGLVSAIPDSILPTYVIGRLFPGVEKGVARDLAKGYVADRAMKALRAAGIVGTEAATEYFQEGVNVVARNLKDGKDALTFTPEDLRRFREAGISGAFGGAIAAPTEFITPREGVLPAATAPDELGAISRAATQARTSIVDAERAALEAEAERVEQERNAEAARLLAEQQAAITQGVAAQDAAAQQQSQAAVADEAAMQQTALSMVGETPELAAQREAERAALNMAGARPIDMTDPAQAAAAVGRSMLGSVPTEQATPIAAPSPAPNMEPEKAEAIRAAVANPATQWQYIVQRPMVPGGKGFIQVDAILNGENVVSSSPEDLRAFGAKIPDVPDSLPQGQYSLEQIVTAGLPPATAVKVATTPAPVKDAVVPEGKAAPAFRTAQTATPEFKAWFGGSKVVDEKGEPLVVYKAMYPRDWRDGEGNGQLITSIDRPSEFPAFNQGEPGVKIAGFFGDKETANRFAESAGTEQAIYPTFLSIKNPKVIDGSGQFAGDIQFGKTGKDFRDAIRSGQYDGVIIQNTKDEGTIYVALEPTQIKSAIGNRGTFDPANPDITYRQSPAQSSLEATKSAQFNAAVSNLRNLGGNVQTFSQEMLAQNTREVIDQRITALQQEQAATQDPAVQQELQQRIATLQERAQQADQAQGVTYGPWQIALAMDDISNANANNLVTLLHEAAESLTMRLTPEQQGAVSSAVNASLSSIRARAQEASQQTGVPLARESSAEDLLAETLAQEMTARGVPEAPSLAQAIVRWVKDAYYRTAMAMQAAFGGEPNPSLALAWFENQLRREVSGDFDYAFANILDRYLPSPMQERVRRFDGRTGTPGGISDFVDPVLGTGTQPQVETLNRDALNWNMQFRQAGDPGADLSIRDPEARARIKGAMLNGLAEFYETLRGQIAPDMPMAQFFQQIKRTGEEDPTVILSALEQQFPGAGNARIGGERMTDAMNKQAQVELWSRLRKFGLSLRRQAAQAKKAVAEGTALLSSTASTVNRLEGDLRNAAMHEDLLKLSAKDMVSDLMRAVQRGYATAQLEGALAQAIRQEENLLSTDEIPQQYQRVLENLYAGTTPVFTYVKAIAEMDLPLIDMSVRDIVKAIRSNPTGSLDLGRLAQDRALTVALAALAKQNADQVDQIALGWTRDMAKFAKIHAQLEQIKTATSMGLRDMLREMNERGKAAGLASRLRASYLEKRRKQQALSDRLARAEERLALLEKMTPEVDKRADLAAQDAGGAQYEWTPEEGAIWTAMKPEGGAWRKVRRVLRFNPDGSAQDAEQLQADIADNFEWLRAHKDNAGTPAYNQIAAQTYSLRLLDARGQQQRTWNAGIISWLPRAIDRFVRSPAATARSIGGPAFTRIIQMLHKYQFILRSYMRTVEKPAVEWQYEFRRLREASGLKDNGEFISQVYGPAMYFIATNPGLDEAAAIRQASNLVRRSLPAPREDFGERFAAFMRKTKEAESQLLEIAEQYGVFVQDKKLGTELRRAVARGYLTGMRSINGGVVDVITKDMQNAGWRLSYEEQERVGKMVRTNMRANTFASLDPTNAVDEQARAQVMATLASDAAMRPLMERLFTPSIIGTWLEPFIRKTGQEPFSYNGQPIPQALSQEAWVEAGGDVLTWIDRLGLKLGVRPTQDQDPKAAFRLSMLRNLDGLFGHEAKLAYEASQTPGLLDPMGAKPHALMDARVSDLLPAEHVEFSTYEPETMHRLLARVAFHGAFGRNARNMQAAFRENMDYLNGRMSQWTTLTALHTTKAAREAEAKRRGWDYNELQSAARRYEEAKAFKTQLEAVLGVSADSGPLGDFHKGMAIVNFVAGQIVDNPKTAAYNLLSPAMRPFAQRSLGPTAISNTVRAYGDLLQTALGSVFQSFGLHLLKAGKYADTIGNAEGRAFSNLPYGVVMSDMGHSGDDQAGANKWLIKPLRIARNLQRKGLQMGAGEAVEFPRLSVIPGLGVINSLSQIESQSSGARLAQELEQVVRDGIAYMDAHPEAANNPSFRFKASDLFGKLDEGLMEWWRQKTVEYNMGTLENLVRDAARRMSEDPKARLLTDDQALIVSMMNHNELSGNSSVNTTPAWLMTNRFLQMSMPLLRWPLWMMSAVHESAKPRAGENAVRPMLRVLGTLALWNLPIGLAFSLLMDEYDKRLLGKKSNLPNLDKTAALPLIGLPLTMIASDKPLSQLEAMLVRSARAGNVYGLGADVAASAFAGLDPSTGQRTFSLDQRVLAYSQIATLGQALLNWKAQEGQATWGSVGRPVLMAVGGNGALHGIDLANHLLGLDNAQSRLTERAAAANWIRSSAQELDIEVRKAAFGGTPTPLSANTREMYLAALANDRADFLESYKRALAASRIKVAQDPDVPEANKEREAVNRVLASWRARDPMGVLANKPTAAEVSRILSIMDPVGQETVRTAMARYESFSALIEPSPLARYMQRQQSTQRRAVDPEALRRRIGTGSLLFSTR